jgi:perosamine synthetase
MSRKIKLFEPSITQSEIDSVVATLTSGWLGLGPKVSELETKFSHYIGSRYATGLDSCTTALEMAANLLNVKGGEVLVPALTFVSTAHAVVRAGAKPIFCEVNPSTLLLDEEDVKRKITSKTKAIIPVHHGGNVVSLPDFGIPIIEDCAHATGSIGAGTHGAISCFSFQAVKNLCAGDGGMLVTNNEEFYNHSKSLRWLGISRDTYYRVGLGGYQWEYEVNEISDKGYMNDITASLALSQLERLDQMNQQRKIISSFYMDNLTKKVSLPIIQKGSSTHLFVIQCPSRDKLFEYLSHNGITAGVHYKPINLYRCYGDYQPCPVTEKLWTQLLSLPMHANLTIEDAEYVVETINHFFERR